MASDCLFSDSDSASPESEALCCHSASLVKAISDPSELSWELFAKKIIDGETRDKAHLPTLTLSEKNNVLVSAVIRRVEARPERFHHFMDLLKDSDEILRELGGKMEATYNKCAKQFTPVAEEQMSSTTKHPSHSPTEHLYHSPSSPQWSSSPLLVEQSSAPPLATHPSLLPPPLQSPVCRYANYLRAFYQTSELPVCDKFPPTPSTTFINLAVIGREKVSSKELERFKLATLHGGIDQILHVKAPIQIEDILTPKPGETLKIVLVEGAPGVGKTTLAWEISKRWGKGELFQQFAIVILLRLRDQTVQNANSITDLIFYQDKHCQEDEGCRKEISKHLIQIDGRDTLIILEGLDELPRHLLMQPSVFTRLLWGTLLPHATILITSRPSITVQLWQYWHLQLMVSQHIEVLGFTEENITQYIASVLSPQELPGFQNYLSINTHIKTTMYIPLHAAIVIEVYRWCQHPRRPLPKTITQLYTCLVLIILRRYLDSHPDYKGRETHFQTVTDLPPPVYEDFYSLAQLAYTGVTQQKLIFQDQDQPIHHLGFMDTVTELFPTLDNQVNYSYNFLHLSIQEYLAAYYVSTMETHQQEQLLETMCKEVHLKNMAQFLAGITKFKDMDRAIVKKIITGENDSVSEREEERTMELSTYALQLLYECEDASILDSHRLYSCALYGYNPLFDFSTLGYCITHSNCKWRLWFGNEYQTIKLARGIQTLVEVLNSHSNSIYTYSIEKIYCYYDAPECAEQLLAGIPQNVLPQLQELVLETDYNHHQPLPQCMPELIPAMISLHTLSVSCTAGVTTLHRLVRAVTCTNTLKLLQVDSCDINHECITTLCQWLSTSSQLEVLTITDLSLPSGVELILKSLTANTTLETLSLEGSKFSLPAGLAMCAMLSHNNTITRVNLEFCHINDDIICCLAEGLQSNSTLTHLILSHNSISDRGGEAIAQALHNNSTLIYLQISDNKISDSGVVAIAEVLHSNNTLTTMDIRWNLISDKGAESIAQALCSNNTLTTLDIGENLITDRGIIYMAKMLKINNTLQKMDLCYNKISDEGKVLLKEVEKTNKHIKLIYGSQKGMIDTPDLCSIF